MPEKDRQNNIVRKQILQIAALVIGLGAFKVLYWTLALEGTLFTWQVLVNTVWLLSILVVAAMVLLVLHWLQRK